MVESVVKQADRLLAALSSLCTKDNSDVCIECEEQKFYCHAVVLKARSMVFFKLLESGNDVIRIDGVKASIMNIVINYIYTSQVEFTADTLVDMIVAAFKFELPTLQEKCLKVFRNQINFDNAVDVLIVADRLQLEEFRAVALTSITKNRAMLMADPQFRKKMVDNPEILLVLYDKVCQEPSEEMSTSLASSQSSSSSSGSLWTCVCGSTAIGQYCSWCGYSST